MWRILTNTISFSLQIFYIMTKLLPAKEKVLNKTEYFIMSAESSFNLVMELILSPAFSYYKSLLDLNGFLMSFVSAGHSLRTFCFTIRIKWYEEPVEKTKLNRVISRCRLNIRNNNWYLFEQPAQVGKRYSNKLERFYSLCSVKLNLNANHLILIDEENQISLSFSKDSIYLLREGALQDKS